MKTIQDTINIAGHEIAAGERRTLDLPIPSLYTHTQLEMPVQIIRGRRPGPCLFLSAALHGDEINGVEIIRRVLNKKALASLRGTLIAIPVVNVFGFINQSRYLPDRRDLNRTFPGSESGSLASRIAHKFLSELVAHCSHGIDLHTAAIHRENFPHVRAELDDEETSRMATAFGSPVIINSEMIEGSLRKAAEALGVNIIVYEAGEALRFNEISIRAGVRGVLAVMREIGMLPKPRLRRFPMHPAVATGSSWIRAPKSGIVRVLKALGAKVAKDEILGMISDPFGEQEVQVLAPFDGIIIGKSNLPLVNEGEALFHIARFKSSQSTAAHIEQFQQGLDNDKEVASGSEPPLN